MNELDIIKKNIRHLFETTPEIHVNVEINKPRISLRNEPATIKGVYPHIFELEEMNRGFLKKHAIQYTEVLVHHVEIVELRPKGTQEDPR